MASTATKANGQATQRKSAHKASVDYLQDALKDLGKARDKAGKDVDANIDAAMERISEVREDLTARSQDRMSNWRGELEDAAEDVRRELGRFAVRAQRTPEALTELSHEIRERKEEISSS